MTAAQILSVSKRFRDDGAMSDWVRLGQYVVDRRVELGYKQRAEFAAALGVSTRVLGDIEKGRRGNFDATTFAALERVLDWETGSARRIADGGEPRLRQDPAAAPAPGPASSGARRLPDEIELIYASRSMTAHEKLAAIRTVLQLRAEVEAADQVTGNSVSRRTSA